MLENQFHTFVKIIQSDGSGEFVNLMLKNFFDSKEIIHHISCPGTLEQNGLAKHHYRHIVETSLTLLAHSSLPPKFWTANFSTSIFLIN